MALKTTVTGTSLKTELKNLPKNNIYVKSIKKRETVSLKDIATGNINTSSEKPKLKIKSSTGRLKGQ